MNHPVLLIYISVIVCSTFIWSLVTVCKCVMSTTGLCRRSCQAAQAACQQVAVTPQATEAGTRTSQRSLLHWICQLWIHEPTRWHEARHETQRAECWIKLIQTTSGETMQNTSRHRSLLHTSWSVERNSTSAVSAFWIQNYFCIFKQKFTKCAMSSAALFSSVILLIYDVVSLSTCCYSDNILN